MLTGSKISLIFIIYQLTKTKNKQLCKTTQTARLATLS
jgi:hypothetical protein